MSSKNIKFLLIIKVKILDPVQYNVLMEHAFRHKLNQELKNGFFPIKDYKQQGNLLSNIRKKRY